MPIQEAPCVELGSAPRTPSVIASPSPSEISSASSPEPQNVRATPLFRALAMPPPDPEQPPGQDELERRLPGYRRIVIPRDLTLIELLKQCSGVTIDDEVLTIREAKLCVVAERVGLRRLHVLVPHLRSLILDGSALSSLRDLGIGLVHLKILSVNRCSLTSLDGVWGLGALRELYAAGNRLQDLQPLAALQKLHTLNLANNPILESGRIWTLAICGSLRRLILDGSPISESFGYRSIIASTLPMLISLDDRPLHTDLDGDYVEEEIDLSDSNAESEDERVNEQLKTQLNVADSEPGCSSQSFQKSHEESVKGDNDEKIVSVLSYRRRPATADCTGVRPLKPLLPPRPRTALERPSIDAPTRLQIMNTLMDQEWRCSGSKLTSSGAVCGNLTHALRRPALTLRSAAVMEKQLETVERSMLDACREIAAEIPRALCDEEWDKFRKETGINIEINFNERPQSVDPTEALERLERIERETSERLSKPQKENCYKTIDKYKMFTNVSSFESWMYNEDCLSAAQSDIDSIFSDN